MLELRGQEHIHVALKFNTHFLKCEQKEGTNELTLKTEVGYISSSCLIQKIVWLQLLQELVMVLMCDFIIFLHQENVELSDLISVTAIFFFLT